MTEAIDSNLKTTSTQADFLKLFMQELTYQDPLKPIDNREFMAQMAQFSALQEAQSTSQALEVIRGLSIGMYSLMLLGKKVTLQNDNKEGVVNKIEFSPEGFPLINVLIDGSSKLIKLSELSSIF